MKEQDSIYLKWGTITRYSLHNNPKAFQKLKEFGKLGMTSSSMYQIMTPAHIEKLCEIIDAFVLKSGYIMNDWTGVKYKTKKAAKEYIRNYDRIR